MIDEKRKKVDEVGLKELIEKVEKEEGPLNQDQREGIELGYWGGLLWMVSLRRKAKMLSEKS